jgi:HSP20 family protein
MAKAMRAEKGRAIVPRIPTLAQRIFEPIDEMLGERWGPWWPMFRWPEEILRTPTVDVYEEGDSVVLKAELPGLKKEELEVQVVGDVVTISGKKEKEEKVERKDYFRVERSAGSFHRAVHLPVEIQVEKVTAQLKDGVLEIRAPRAEEAKVRSRKVEVA